MSSSDAIKSSRLSVRRSLRPLIPRTRSIFGGCYIGAALGSQIPLPVYKNGCLSFHAPLYFSPLSPPVLYHQTHQTMSVATKSLSTEQMTEISQGKDNEYALLYYPFHGVVAAVRVMLAMSDLKYKFTHPVVRTKSRHDKSAHLQPHSSLMFFPNILNVPTPNRTGPAKRNTHLSATCPSCTRLHQRPGKRSRWQS